MVMKRLSALYLLAAFFFIAPVAFAQDDAQFSTDEIITKSTDTMMFQITANMKLTQDQINAVREIVIDNIVKIRKLQLSLEDGTIDGKTMYDKKKQLTQDEDQTLSRIFTPDQMKIWLNIQNP